MMLYPLRKEKLAVQAIVFIIIWFLFQFIASVVWTSYLNSTFGSSDVQQLLATHQDDVLFKQSVIWGNAAQQILTFLCPPLIFAAWSSKKPLSYIGFRQPDFINFKILILFAVSILMLYSLPRLGAVVQLLPLGDVSDQLQATRKAMEEMYFEDVSVPGLMRNVLIMAAIPAFCEELFFRGVFQRLLFSATRSIWLSILMTGAFFTFLHASIINFLSIMIAAVILGLIYHYTKNIWYSIIAHFIFNGAQVWMNYLYRISGPEAPVSDMDPGSISLVTHGAFILISFLMIYILMKRYYMSYRAGHAALSDKDWSFEEKH